MNVNISTQFLSNFQGNNLSTEVKDTKNEFTSFLENIENTGEESSIDYELILSVLSNIKIFENLNLDKLDNLKNIDLKGINPDNVNDIFLNIINEEVGNNGSDNQLVFMNDLTINSSSDKNDKLLNHIMNVVQSEDMNIKDVEKFNLKDLTDIIKDNLLNEGANNEASLNKTSDVDKQIQVEVLYEDKYRQLEISSLNSKNNTLKEVNIDDKNKDLYTLENILDVGENNNLLFLNKTISNIDTSNQDGVNTEPLNIIRQEFIEEDIVKTVRYLKSNGIEEIKIKISPRELGDMTIKLIKNGDETNLNITITKDDVFELVNKNISDITKHLNELDIKLKDISVDIKNNSENIFSDDLDKQFDKKEQQGNDKKNKNKYKYNKNFDQIEDIVETVFEEESLNILI